MRTWLQSQSSSSATIIGSEVFMPCPISGFLDTMVTVPSGAMETKAESCAGAAVFPSIASNTPAGSGIRASSARPPPASSDALSTVRRVRSAAACSCDTTSLLFHTRSDPDRTSNPVVAAAAADVAGHCRVNLIDIRLGCLPEQRARGHDLPGLTVAALHHIDFQPRLLQSGADLCSADMLDRVDLSVADTAHRQLAGASRCPIHMDRAGAAESLSASILGADQSQLVAQHPQQRHVRRNVDLPTRAIDIESIRHTCTCVQREPRIYPFPAKGKKRAFVNEAAP